MSNSKEAYRQLISDVRKTLKEQFTIEDSLLASEELASFFQRPIEKLIPSPIPVAQKTSSPRPVIEKSLPPLKKEQESIPLKELKVKIDHQLEIPSTPLQAPKEREDEWSPLLKRVAPKWALTDQIPDDEEAKRISNKWKENFSTADVAIVYFEEKEKDLNFLKNLTEAIQTRLSTAALINGKKMEEEKKWDLFLKDNPAKLFLATPSLQKAAEMKRFYKELPSTSECFLGNAPLIFLAAPSSYFNDPSLKQALWKNLCQRLKG